MYLYCVLSPYPVWCIYTVCCHPTLYYVFVLCAVTLPHTIYLYCGMSPYPILCKCTACCYLTLYNVYVLFAVTLPHNMYLYFLLSPYRILCICTVCCHHTLSYASVLLAVTLPPYYLYVLYAAFPYYVPVLCAVTLPRTLCMYCLLSHYPIISICTVCCHPTPSRWPGERLTSFLMLKIPGEMQTRLRTHTVPVSQDLATSEGSLWVKLYWRVFNVLLSVIALVQQHV